MLLKICGTLFDSQSIKNLSINNGQCYIDTDDDYYIFRIKSPDDIAQAEDWLKFSTITEPEIRHHYNTIIMVCSYHINRKEQCNSCPIKHKKGCIFPTPPINWRLI